MDLLVIILIVAEGFYLLARVVDVPVLKYFQRNRRVAATKFFGNPVELQKASSRNQVWTAWIGLPVYSKDTL